MSKVIIEVTKKELKKTIRDSIEYWFGLTCKPKTLLKILKRPENIKLFLEVAEGRGNLDTGEREELGDLIAEEITGTVWPTDSYLSKKRKKEFFTKLKLNAKKKGFTLMGDFLKRTI